MKVGVPVESYPNENRVAVVPSVVHLLVEAGLEVIMQQGAGEKAGFPDSEFEK
ncbi:MAG: NAD(P)(+) transhydrogenase (Re/Si-specific) subunit alpha, partial [Candidatus Marinimicrobia bacterium]|nr:NAD(P)(+) transhydrogenase (Re/Si-specific) subunit alpha [Candidatus Neomarinimicrobiota bacterium]